MPVPGTDNSKLAMQMMNGENNINESTGDGLSLQEGAEQGFFMTIFGFCTTATGKALLMTSPVLARLPLQVYIFPFAALLSLVEVSVEAKTFAAADNQNLQKQASLVHKIFKAALSVLAVTFAVLSSVTGLATLAHLSAAVFLAVLSLGVLFSLTASIYHAVKWFRSPKESIFLRKQHRLMLSKHVLNLFVRIVLTGAIAALFAAGLSTGVGLAVVSGIAMAVIVGALAARFIKQRRAKKAQQTDKLKLDLQSKLEARIKDNSTALSDLSLIVNYDNVRQLTLETVETTHPRGFLETPNFKPLLDKAHEKEQLKEALINIVRLKINHIQEQVDDSYQSKLTRLFKPQQSKRLAKIKALSFVQDLIESSNSDDIQNMKNDAQSVVDQLVTTLRDNTLTKEGQCKEIDSAREHLSKTVEGQSGLPLSTNKVIKFLRRELPRTFDEIINKFLSGKIGVVQIKENFAEEVDRLNHLLQGKGLTEFLRNRFKDVYLSPGHDQSEVQLIVQAVEQYSDKLGNKPFCPSAK